MLFGKIDYLNLLPFHVFIKRHVRSLRQHSAIHYKKGVPSQINKAFKERRVDAAFISSIESKKHTCLDLGIVAKKEVISVRVLPGKSKDDSASATSNALAKQLGIEGEVIIGDRALKHFLIHHAGVDLAQVWNEKTRLPFVFARLCYHKNGCYLKKMTKIYQKSPTRIPFYLLKQASQRTDIPPKEIRSYLKKITYSIDRHEKKSLKKFLHNT